MCYVLKTRKCWNLSTAKGRYTPILDIVPTFSSELFSDSVHDRCVGDLRKGLVRGLYKTTQAKGRFPNPKPPFQRWESTNKTTLSEVGIYENQMTLSGWGSTTKIKISPPMVKQPNGHILGAKRRKCIILGVNLSYINILLLIQGREHNLIIISPSIGGSDTKMFWLTHKTRTNFWLNIVNHRRWNIAANDTDNPKSIHKWYF